MTAAPNLLGLLAIGVALGFLVLAVVTLTAFVKFTVVLFLVRNALGVQQAPPNIVLYGIAIVLTAFVTLPLAQRVHGAVMDPPLRMEDVTDWGEALNRAQMPVREHLLHWTTRADRAFFVAAARRLWTAEGGPAAEVKEDDLAILAPTFLTAELRRGFEIGFLLYLPFTVVDLVVTTILMAMGMSQVQPNTIAVPLKIFLFVLAAGWTRLLHGLVSSYG